MSHLFSDRVGFIRSTVDAFNRLKTSEPFTLFENQMRFNEGYKFSTANSIGTYTEHKPNESVLDMVVDANSGSYVYRESKRVFSYQPGKSLGIMLTFVFAPAKTNLRQRVGYFGNKNGIYLEQNGSDIKLVLRSNVTGTVVNQEVLQSDWIDDPFDGTGASGRILDVSKANIFWIDIEWLGVGDVRCGFIVHGEPITAHTFHNDNVNTTTYMTTACLPVRYEIENTGSTISSSTMKQICTTVISDGGFQGRSLNTRVGHDLTPLYDLTLANTWYPVLSIRLKSTRLEAIVLPNFVDLYSPTNNAIFKYQVRLNGTLTGNTFLPVSDDSSVEYTLTSTEISDGRILESGYFSAGKSGSITIGVQEDFNFQLGRTLANVSDIVTVCVMTDTAGADIGAIIGWNEII